ncbi:MAG TPA: RidA family protein [Thermomicrobiales bacterium]|nr:RidA family protein [Thermomicrobiales bacterium]
MADTPTIRFISPAGLPRPNGYAHVAEITGGRLVFISGQVPLDADNRVVGVGDFAVQARQVFANLERALAAVDLTFADVAKLQMYVVDVSNLPVLRAIRDEFIDIARPPASTTVQVAALFHPDVLFEVDAVAVAPAD